MKIHVSGQRPLKTTGTKNSELVNMRGQNQVSADRAIEVAEVAINQKSVRPHPPHKVSEPKIQHNFRLPSEQVREDDQQEVS